MKDASVSCVTVPDGVLLALCIHVQGHSADKIQCYTSEQLFLYVVELKVKYLPLIYSRVEV